MNCGYHPLSILEFGDCDWLESRLIVDSSYPLRDKCLGKITSNQIKSNQIKSRLSPYGVGWLNDYSA
jgi:hypothetical protein